MQIHASLFVLLLLNVILDSSRERNADLRWMYIACSRITDSRGQLQD